MLSPNKIVATACTKDSPGTFYILSPYFKVTKQPGEMSLFEKLSMSQFTQTVTADPGLEPRPDDSISALNHIPGYTVTVVSGTHIISPLGFHVQKKLAWKLVSLLAEEPWKGTGGLNKLLMPG